jgi:hypothetical protein
MRTVLVLAVVAVLVAGCGGGYKENELQAARNFIDATNVDKSPEELVEIAREALRAAGAKVSGENVRQVLEGAHLSDPARALEKIPDIAKQVAAYERGELGD